MSTANYRVQESGALLLWILLFLNLLRTFESLNCSLLDVKVRQKVQCDVHSLINVIPERDLDRHHYRRNMWIFTNTIIWRQIPIISVTNWLWTRPKILVFIFKKTYSFTSIIIILLLYITTFNPNGNIDSKHVRNVQSIK